MQAFFEQRVGETQQKCSVGVGTCRQPFGIQKICSIVLEWAHVDEVDAVVAAALQPIAGDVPADAAGVNLCVLEWHPAEHHHQLGMFCDNRPRGHGVEHVEKLEAHNMWHDHLGGGGAVAVDRIRVAAELLEKAMNLTLGVVEAPGAGPTVGASEDRLVAVQFFYAPQFTGDQIQGFVPAYGDKGLGAATAAVIFGAAFQPAFAYRRLQDTALVMNAVLEGLTDGRRIRILFVGGARP